MFVQGAGKSAVLNGLIGHPVLVSTVFFPSFDALITWPESFTCKFFFAYIPLSTLSMQARFGD